MDEKEATNELNAQIKEYKALAKLKNSDELQAYFDLLLKTSTDKMIWAFTGSNVKNWEEYCMVKGEIVSRLQPIQEIWGAQAVADRLNEQLKEYFTPED